MNATKNVFLFDFDGTLVDSMPYFIDLMLRILDENAISYDDDIVKTITPLGYRGTAEYFKSIGLSGSTEEIMAKMQEYAHDAYTNKIEAKDGVIETLTELKRRGVSLNILTASPHTSLDPCLKRLGIFDIFNNVWSCDDFNTTKSNPKIYRLAADKIGEDIDKIIFVDDNINAVKTALKSGMKAFGIYDKSSHDSAEEMKRIADGYIESMRELLYI